MAREEMALDAPAPAKILAVDDHPENLLALEAVLAPLGHEVVRASSGEEALKRLLEQDFAVILLDVQMPGMDGFATAECIKQRERTRHVPIIFLTALSKEPDHALQGYSVGAVDYLFKPFNPAVLRSKVAVFLDLHALRRQAEQLAHRALHDPLTGLPNRVLFIDRTGIALARSGRTAARVGVLFIDLDGFKAINDSLGHEAGDRLLCGVARRLQAGVRPSDTVARLGGDEFTVLSDGLLARDEAVDIAERVGTSLAEPFELGEHLVTVTPSIGVALSGGRDETPDTLIRRADAAMYRAKQAGGARHEVAQPELHAVLAAPVG